MRMLITGGAGFLGSHLCDKYTKEGHTLLCLDSFMSGYLTNIRHLLDYRNFKLIKGDVRDSDLLEKIMRDVDVVFHLAAQIHVDRSYIEPELTYEINVMGTQNILEVARMHDVKRVIHASTSEVYGSAQYVPIDEQHLLNAPHLPMHHQKALGLGHFHLPETERISKEVILLPLNTEISNGQAEYVIESILNFYNGRHE